MLGRVFLMWPAGIRSGGWNSRYSCVHWRQASIVTAGRQQAHSRFPRSRINVSTEFRVRREPAKVLGRAHVTALHQARLPASDRWKQHLRQETCLLGFVPGRERSRGVCAKDVTWISRDGGWPIGCHPYSLRSLVNRTKGEAKSTQYRLQSEGIFFVVVSW